MANKIMSRAELRRELKDYMSDGKQRTLTEIFNYIEPKASGAFELTPRQVAMLMKGHCAVLFHSPHQAGGSVWVSKEKKAKIMSMIEELDDT